jgi:hypothetical protein
MQQRHSVKYFAAYQSLGNTSVYVSPVFQVEKIRGKGRVNTAIGWRVATTVKTGSQW